NFMEIYLSEDSELPKDDLVNNIAWNDDVPQPSVSETVISPDIYEILQGDIQPFSVYKLINGVKNSDTFTILASGSPNECYILSVVDGNNFTIKNLLKSTIPLVISCENNNTHEITTKGIKLLGEY
ncbi:MAG: hypothetical protein RR313_09805, partial [Anaerovoracaceae bacterium]